MKIEEKEWDSLGPWNVNMKIERPPMKIDTGFGVDIEIDHEKEKVRVVNKIAKTEFTEFGITRSVS